MFEVLSTSGDTHLGGDDFDKVGNFLFVDVHGFFVFYCMLSFLQSIPQ